MIRLAGAGQVADHQGDVEELQPVHGAGQHHGFLGAQAQAVHAGVDVQGGVQDPTARVAVPGLDLRQAVEHRRQAGRLDGGGRTGRDAIQQVDRGDAVAQGPAQGHALGQAGDMEAPRAYVPQPSGHQIGAQSVAVGLHGGRDLGAAGGGLEHGVVGGQGVQVEGEEGGFGHGAGRSRACLPRPVEMRCTISGGPGSRSPGSRPRWPGSAPRCTAAGRPPAAT
jgi:hypothetical protein